MRSRSEEMLSYVPPYYQNSKQYRAQNDAKGAELDALRWLIADLENQINPRTATWSLPLWEALCGITSAPGENRSERQDRVFALLIAGSPMTPDEVIKRVRALFGYGIAISKTSQPYVMDIAVVDTEIDFAFTRLRTYLDEILPAHLDTCVNALTELFDRIGCGYAVSEFESEVII